MSIIYLRKDDNNIARKIAVDMAYLHSHKKIRLPKYQYEEGLYFPLNSNDNQNAGKYFLSKDKILNEDEHFYYFKFPFNVDDIEQTAA